MFDLLYNVQFSDTGNEICDLTIFGATKTTYPADSMDVIRNVQWEIEIDDMANLLNSKAER